MPPSTLASHIGMSWLTLAQLVLTFQGHGAVTTWLKLTTTMPAAQAASMVGSSADVDAAWTMMASGFAAMMLLSELICASAEFSTVSTWRLTRPASGGLVTATSAMRCICCSQSLPIRPFDR